MLGDKVGEESGQITSQRVLPNLGGAPKMETSFRSTGTIFGVPGTNTGTYSSIMRPDGTVYGEGQGIVMGKSGEIATWSGQGVGTFKKDGAVSYRGAIYYQTTVPAWQRLNSVACVFEYEVEAQGKTHSQVWEWK